MNPTNSTAARQKWFDAVLPEGVPPLWCPPITHYDQHGAIDRARMEAHWRSLAPYVKALLVPGSTGDGWELTSAEAHQLLEIALDLVARLELRLLVGALRPVAGDACSVITETAKHLGSGKAPTQAADWLAGRRVCGFAVCPPRGRTITQEQMGADLTRILGLGFPIALYQLPQVTQNEMSPGLVASLASQFPNFLLFKDTSGGDAVANSGQDFQGVFMVRGMEGAYDRWLRSAGGPYDGFLLSAANGFAPQLHRLIEQVRAGDLASAADLSRRISTVIDGVFAAVGDIPDGNPFANGNKAIDHFMAHGPEAGRDPPPRLHSGRLLPSEVIRTTGRLLSENSLMPQSGYLAR